MEGRISKIFKSIVAFLTGFYVFNNSKSLAIAFFIGWRKVLPLAVLQLPLAHL
jgi:hypothetical protein